MRILFLGAGAFGLPTLEALAAHHTLLAVVSQPARPAGRGMKLTPTPIAQHAAEHLPAIPLLTPLDVNAPDVLAQVRAFEADAWVVIAFGQKLSPPLLRDRFAVNLHASLLPRWRGAAPINAAILAGDTQTGNSVITLAERMDAGLILGSSTPPRPIDPLVTAGELHDALAGDGPALVLDVLARHAAGTLKGVVQDETLVTKARKLSKADGQLTPADWHLPAELIRRRVHGLTPWPGVTATLALASGPVTLKLLRTQVVAGPVTAVRTTDHPSPSPDGVVPCGEGTALQLLEVHAPGGRPMGWAEFWRGRKS